MKPPFTSSQEMYNYAANQLINQNLSPETVKNNLMERGVTDADAETCVQNMLVVIEKRRKAEGDTREEDTRTADHAYSSSQKENYVENNHGSFYDVQAMYNYAANQLIVQKLNQQTVKHNLVKKGVSDVEADTVIANMMIEIEKDKPVETSTSRSARNTPSPSTATGATTSTGAFPSSQEMYNYAANQMIVKKQSPETVKGYLIHHGVSATDADEVIKNMMAEIQKNKPAEVNAKRAEGKRMMLIGVVIFAIGAVLYGANFTVAGESFVVSYGLLAVGAIMFFKGLFKMF